jgi:hypothetical protein
MILYSIVVYAPQSLIGVAWRCRYISVCACTKAANAMVIRGGFPQNSRTATVSKYGTRGQEPTGGVPLLPIDLNWLAEFAIRSPLDVSLHQRLLNQEWQRLASEEGRPNQPVNMGRAHTAAMR